MVAGFSWRDGWHPEKHKTSGSSRRDSGGGQFKGVDQVKSFVNSKIGKESSPADGDHYEHRGASRPLSSLTDPASFPPPPKKHGSASGSAAPPQPPRRSEQQLQDTETQQITPTQSLNTGRYPQYEEAPQPPPPPPRNASVCTPSSSYVSPRQKPYPTPYSANQQLHTEADALASTPGLNQSAMGRLGAAGVSIPGLEIGQQSGRAQTSPSEKSQSPVGEPVRDELQARLGSIRQRPVSYDQPEYSATPPPLPRHPLDMPESPYYQQQQQRMRSSTSDSLSSTARKKAPPPPPPKKPNLQLR